MLNQATGGYNLQNGTCIWRRGMAFFMILLQLFFVKAETCNSPMNSFDTVAHILWAGT